MHNWASSTLKLFALQRTPSSKMTTHRREKTFTINLTGDLHPECIKRQIAL